MAGQQVSSPVGLNVSRQSLGSLTRDSEASPPELRLERSSSSNEACKEMEEMLQEEELNEDPLPPKPAAKECPSTPTRPRIQRKKRKANRRGNSQQLRTKTQQQRLQQSSLPALQPLPSTPSQNPTNDGSEEVEPPPQARVRDLRHTVEEVREKVGAPQSDDPEITPDPPQPRPRLEGDHFRVEVWCKPQPLPASMTSAMFVTSLNLLVLDLGGGLTDVVAREWLPGGQGNTMHLFISYECRALFEAFVLSETELKPKLHGKKWQKCAN